MQTLLPCPWPWRWPFDHIHNVTNNIMRQSQITFAWPGQWYLDNFAETTFVEIFFEKYGICSDFYLFQLEQERELMHGALSKHLSLVRCPACLSCSQSETLFLRVQQFLPRYYNDAVTVHCGFLFEYNTRTQRWPLLWPHLWRDVGT